MMLPMTMKCYTCGTYTYIGTKCNMKVEPVEDEDYLGITLYRFYYRCSNCFSQITFKTDPKNNDYTAEIGASRNHQPWKDIMLAEEEYKNNKKKEMKDDAMKNLEYRTYDSKREMDILEATDKVKELNRREANIDFNGLIKKIREYHDKEKEKEKLENNILNNETIKDKDKEKQILNEKKEIEKMFKYIKNKKKEENKDNKDDNKDILDKLIKGIDIKNNKTNKNKEKDRENKEKSLKEKIENNFFLKKKLEREEKSMEKNRNKQFSNFLDEKDEENSENSNSEDKRKINDIFKKPLINFSKLKKKK